MIDMRPLTHNGFVLKYDGPLFAASKSNAITYECFCLMGGLSNDRLQKVQHWMPNGNGNHFYETYHRCDVP